MALSWPLNSFAWLVIDYCKGIDATLPFLTNLQFSKLKVTDKWLTYHVDTRKGYVALATHGRVALILRMNGSERM